MKTNKTFKVVSAKVSGVLIPQAHPVFAMYVDDRGPLSAARSFIPQLVRYSTNIRLTTQRAVFGKYWASPHKPAVDVTCNTWIQLLDNGGRYYFVTWDM